MMLRCCDMVLRCCDMMLLCCYVEVLRFVLLSPPHHLTITTFYHCHHLTIYNNGVPDSTTYVPERAYCIYYDTGAGAGKMIGLKYTGKNIRPVYNPKEATGILSVSSPPKVLIGYSEGTLSIHGLNNPATVRVTDMSGREYKSAKFGRNASIEMNLPRGFYIVSVSDASGTLTTKKIIVKK